MLNLIDLYFVPAALLQTKRTKGADPSLVMTRPSHPPCPEGEVVEEQNEEGREGLDERMDARSGWHSA
jgi:hypothetical protein